MLRLKYSFCQRCLKWVLGLKFEEHKAGQIAGDIETNELFREIKQASMPLFDSWTAYKKIKDEVRLSEFYWTCNNHSKNTPVWIGESVNRRRGNEKEQKKSSPDPARFLLLVLVPSLPLSESLEQARISWCTGPVLIGVFHVTSSPPCLVDDNKGSLISIFCVSTRNRTFLYCRWCPKRLVKNVL